MGKVPTVFVCVLTYYTSSLYYLYDVRKYTSASRKCFVHITLGISYLIEI